MCDSIYIAFLTLSLTCIEFHGLSCVCFGSHGQSCTDLGVFLWDALAQRLGCPAACGSLRPKAVAPLEYQSQSPGLAGWQDGVWLAEWLNGCVAGWFDGCMGGSL